MKKHANFINPFRDLLSSKNKFKWERNHDIFLQELKENFSQAVSLSHYMRNKQFCMQTDASKKGISVILFQVDNEGHERIIAIVSRCLTLHEVNYTITELELLAIIYGLTKFQKYLLGNKFKIYTDHSALTFLLKTQFYNSRLMRWSLLISNFSFEIIHCKGVDNPAADFLRRIVTGKIANEIENKLTIAKININKNKEKNQVIPLIKNLAKIQQNNQKTKNLHEKLKSNEEIKNYTLKNNIILHKTENFNRWRALIPKNKK